MRYLKSINEELNISKLSDQEFDKLVKNVIDNLDQYRNSILSNIEYNLKTNKIEYKEFDNINISQMISQLNSDLGNDIVNQFNIETFLRFYHKDGLGNVLKNVDYWIRDNWTLIDRINKIKNKSS
jgi:hypothetical protein